MSDERPGERFDDPGQRDDPDGRERADGRDPADEGGGWDGGARADEAGGWDGHDPADEAGGWDGRDPADEAGGWDGQRPDGSRDTALAVGRRAERAAAAALDRIEDLGLRMQQQGLASGSTGDSFRDLGPALLRLRRRAVPLPRQVGQVAAGSTYFALRMGMETYRTVVGLLDETTRLFGADERREP